MGGGVRRVRRGDPRRDDERGHDREPHGPDGRPRARRTRRAPDGHGRPAPRAVLLGGGALLRRARRGGPGPRSRRRARDPHRRPPGHEPGGVCRGDRRRRRGGHHADGGRRDGRDDADRRGRSARGARRPVRGARRLAARRRRLRAPGGRDGRGGAALRGPRPRRLRDRRCAQVALRAQGVLGAARPRPAHPAGRVRARGGVHPARRGRGAARRRPDPRVLAAAARAEALARVHRARRRRDPRGDRSATSHTPGCWRSSSRQTTSSSSSARRSSPR